MHHPKLPSSTGLQLFLYLARYSHPNHRRSTMKRLIRKINGRKAKRIAKLSGITAAIIMLFILLEPLYSFGAKVFYAYICFVALLRIWSEGTRDWDVLVAA